jgi:GDP-4-dehydro-6-deoxy-D-mannose reductase
MGTAVVFAGNSFLGKTLCPVLRQRGVRVVATARGNDLSLDYVPCDLTRHADVESLLKCERPDWVIQCAGATRAAESREMYDLHVGGTLAVLSAAARHAPLATILLLGSAAEYGPVAADCLPINESCPENPATPFGASKLAQTHLARAAARQCQLRVLTVRPFNVIGPGLPDHYFAAALARRLLRMRSCGDPGPFPVMNLDATRDFVDVRDVADALVGLLSDAPPTAGEMEVYNIATGIEVSLADVATKLGSLAGGYKPMAGAGGDSRGGVVRSRGDATRLSRKTGWLPRRTWEESLNDLWESLPKD